MCSLENVEVKGGTYRDDARLGIPLLDPKIDRRASISEQRCTSALRRAMHIDSEEAIAAKGSRPLSREGSAAGIERSIVWHQHAGVVRQLGATVCVADCSSLARAAAAWVY